ncbi:MAG: hypothetical protein ACRDKA_10175 [Actinomycetota bacterium]
MTRVARDSAPLVWVGFGVFVLGRVIDLIWHATHPEFETAGDQIGAHAVVCIGVLILLVAAVRAVAARPRAGGYLLLLAAVVLDVAVSAWHFWEHYNHRDPDLPHVLLLVANIGIFTAIGWLWLSQRKRRRSRIGAST